MAVITYLGESYTVDHAVKGANYIHGYDAEGIMVVSFEGVTNFSDFTYSGTYMNPETCLAEGCNDVKYAGGSLKKRDGTELTPSDFGAASKTHEHTKSEITDFPSSMPASDVYSWAKSENKPSYTASEVGAAPENHDHSNQLIAPAAIDLRPGTGAGHGGYVDFNYNNSAQDYTTRLIEHNAGHLYMNIAGSSDNYPVHTAINKPNGSYTGSGSATSRDIVTHGIGTCVVVWNQYGIAIVTGNGAIVCDAASGSVTFLDASKAKCVSGTIKLSTDNNCLNANGVEHWYQVL